jgi:acetate kinase
MTETILVVNAGSSSIKFMLFALDGGNLRQRMKGQIEGIGARLRLKASESGEAPIIDEARGSSDSAGDDEAVGMLEAWLESYLAGALPVAVGHRVVHGGLQFDKPVLIDKKILAALEDLIPLAPLHQPINLGPIKSIRRRWPDTPQVACFDSAFHRGQDEVVQRYAIPESLWRAGIRRYGFHGLSYDYIARALLRLAPNVAEGKVIVAHLGNGASLCSMKNGQSIETSMGFTALDGLPMGTRPGQLDPGVLLHLVKQKGMSGQDLEKLLYHECGLKGLSGFSNDVRDLLASDHPGAVLALQYFCHRTAAQIGALAVGLDGLDALVFTAGIGENVPEIRKGICDRLGLLGIELDEKANALNSLRISPNSTHPAVLVVPTNEERMIAEHTREAVRGR